MSPIHKNRIKLWYNTLLRSKKQTVGRLKDKNGRCCLGVLCDVYKNNTGKGSWGKTSHPRKMCTFLGKPSFLPIQVMKWFGLESDNPQLIHNNEKHSASNLNDTKRLSFKQIAQCVRDTYLRNE